MTTFLHEVDKDAGRSTCCKSPQHLHERDIICATTPEGECLHEWYLFCCFCGKERVLFQGGWTHLKALRALVKKGRA